MTEPGLTGQGIIGTFPYMAPEQLEGKHADHRVDLWAFGCIVYEMATGQRAFHGSTQAGLIGAILHTEPAPISLKQPLVPSSLDRTVMRCLAKDPDSRWQTATDLAAELNWIAADATAPVVTAKKRDLRLREIIAWACVAIALLACVAFGLFAFGRSTRDLALTRLDVVTPPTSDPISFALSPDGRELVFSAPSDGVAKLWLRPLDQFEARLLPDTHPPAHRSGRQMDGQSGSSLMESSNVSIWGPALRSCLQGLPRL
jgi:serine/threonine protein kinase